MNPASRRRPQPRTVGGGNEGDTGSRAVLVRTAERLFAERGIAAVSLREIGERAGQRNKTAVHYYFGDREGLVRAILSYRAENVNTRREEMLANLERSGRLREVGALAEALVVPLAEQVSANNHYVGFLPRLNQEPSWSSWREALDSSVAASYRQVVQLLRARLPDVRGAVFANRVMLATDLTFHALAARQAGVRPQEAAALSDSEFVAELVRVVAAVLAPD